MKNRIENLDLLDLGEIKWASLVGGILLVKLVPSVASLHWGWYVVIIVILVIRPYIHWFKQ
jgi:hypothetical protein